MARCDGIGVFIFFFNRFDSIFNDIRHRLRQEAAIANERLDFGRRLDRKGDVGLCDFEQENGLPQDIACILDPEGRLRSEEHTSELQSLMRLSYAVFFIKKKQRIMRNEIKINRQQQEHNTGTSHYRHRELPYKNLKHEITLRTLHREHTNEQLPNKQTNTHTD